ncbi:MAG: RidA family protein [Bryobacterales bacterium]|nr:RidA family protein [Bryobacterales bacterium]
MPLHPVAVEVAVLPPNNHTYSQAVKMGDLVFVSGQLGVDPRTRRLVDGGIAEQTRQAIENVSTVLAAAGSGLAGVGKVNIFIRHFSDLPAMNKVYAEYFVHRPAKTTVEIGGLDQGALIEIEVVAAVFERRDD